PMPAASIITPMIDLAFTRRPSFAIQTSLWNFAAVWVNCADGRACSPSLLLIVNVREIIALRTALACRLVLLGRDRCDLQHALSTTREGFFDGIGKLAVAITERAQQHRQVHTRDYGNAAGLGQTRRDIAGRRAEDVRQDENACTRIDLLDQSARLFDRR